MKVLEVRKEGLRLVGRLGAVLKISRTGSEVWGLVGRFWSWYEDFTGW